MRILLLAFIVLTLLLSNTVDCYVVVDVEGIQLGGGFRVFGRGGASKVHNGETCFVHDVPAREGFGLAQGATRGFGYREADESARKSVTIHVNYKVLQSGDRTSPTNQLEEAEYVIQSPMELIVKDRKSGVPLGLNEENKGVWMMNFGRTDAIEVPVTEPGQYSVCIYNRRPGTRRVTLHIEDSFDVEERERAQVVARSEISGAGGGGGASYANLFGPHDEVVTSCYEYFEKGHIQHLISKGEGISKLLHQGREAFNGTVQSTYNRIIFFTIFNLLVVLGGIALQTVQIQNLMKEKKVV